MSKARKISEEASGHKAGFVTLLGPPNAGKSTLLNRLIGEKLAIVSAKPQTTRSRILGILTLPQAQLLLQDTPGLHEGGSGLNASMNESVLEAARDCDVGLLMVDRRTGWNDFHEALIRHLKRGEKPFVVVGTKMDRLAGANLDWLPAAVAAEECVLSISALTGEGIVALLEETIARLPASPALYPEEDLTDRPLRWLCGELVREAAFEELKQELPYAIAVDVLGFDESRAEQVMIDANVLVERTSQKRIVVGAGGRTIKAIGTKSRRGIERLVGKPVYLKLFVKVDPRWQASERRLRELGYQ